MGNIYFCLFIALFSFQAFSFTYQISGFRKTIINTPFSIFETSIPVINANQASFAPFFDKNILETRLNAYYEQALSKFTNGYEMSLFYYSTNDDLLCKGDQCDGVKVSVKGKIMFSYVIEEKMFYEIKDNRK